jgi:hypothetical protein
MINLEVWRDSEWDYRPKKEEKSIRKRKPGLNPKKDE